MHVTRLAHMSPRVAALSIFIFTDFSHIFGWWLFFLLHWKTFSRAIFQLKFFRAPWNMSRSWTSKIICFSSIYFLVNILKVYSPQIIKPRRMQIFFVVRFFLRNSSKFFTFNFLNKIKLTIFSIKNFINFYHSRNGEFFLCFNMQKYQMKLNFISDMILLI